MGDRKRSKQVPPDSRDPRYRRTCTRCLDERDWTEARCAKCGNAEFMLLGSPELRVKTN